MPRRRLLRGPVRPWHDAAPADRGGLAALQLQTNQPTTGLGCIAAHNMHLFSTDLPCFLRFSLHVATLDHAWSYPTRLNIFPLKKRV